MSKNAVNRLLSDTDKGVSQTSGTGGMLARIFREFLVSYRLSFDQWERHIRDYVKEVAEEEAENALASGNTSYVHDKGHLTSLRTNLRNALSEKTMSWPTFIKGVRFFRKRKFKFEVYGTQASTGKELRASIDVYVNEKDRKANNGEYSDICLNAVMRQLLKQAGLSKMQGPLWKEYLDVFIGKEPKTASEEGDPSGADWQPNGSLQFNLKKKLTRDSMKWSTFITGLRFLQLTTATIVIELSGSPAMLQELVITIDKDYQHDDTDE